MDKDKGLALESGKKHPPICQRLVMPPGEHSLNILIISIFIITYNDL